eukprot:Phypoly_transcript_10340.p1 GENE.Phypoly_transcript_10340~~Phypoly_transcript_10340.p1  ORF type:complete len:373 (+),score=75.67 Phypoly_transcript_10340:166-1284(+)
MVDTSITRKLSFGSRTFPIDKYLNGIDDTELHGLHYYEKLLGLPYVSKEDCESQKNQFSSVKYNYEQNNVMLKMHENMDATFDMSDVDEKLKRAKQMAKEDKKEKQKLDQELKQVMAQIVQFQQQYQEMQLHLRHHLAPLNHSCDVSLSPDDKEKDATRKYKTIETQTDGEYEEPENYDDDDGEDFEQSFAHGAERMAFQRDRVQKIAGYDQIELTSEEATIRIGRDTLKFAIEEGKCDAAGAYCDAAFCHGDILDYAAKINAVELLCYNLQERLQCRDAIAADVAQLQQLQPNTTWDNAWQVSVTLPNGQTANLGVDHNYGTGLGKVRVLRWSALDDALPERCAALRQIVDAIHAETSSSLLQVVQRLSSA